MNDQNYMQRCLQLAAKGKGYVSPNPLVGCVIVCEGEIISEGFHQYYGQAHAERNAILSCSSPNLLSKSTLYVNLEPCSHHGKTPPCVDLILEKKIPRVVYGLLDPNPKVAGNGLKKLISSGVEVIGPIMEEECKRINRFFITSIERNRPYIILKWAQSQDGFMDIDRIKNPTKGSFRITDEHLRLIDHKWRAEVDAIMVGTQTLINDDPQLDARCWGKPHPIRIGIDLKQRLPLNLNFFDGKYPTLLYTTQTQKYPKIEGLTTIAIDSKEPLQTILKDLHQKGITSLLVEGGACLLQNLINNNLWDEARIFTAPILIHQGLPSAQLNLSSTQKQYVGNQSIEYYYNNING